jgi:hypothetical protein
LSLSISKIAVFKSRESPVPVSGTVFEYRTY